jgi:hypothetical protein
LKHTTPLPAVALATLALMTLPGSASAGELTWDGHYRARAELFDSLSLSETNPNAEASQWTIDHRARLQPGWILSDRVSLHTQIDLLPYVLWGDEVQTRTDPVTGSEEPFVFSDRLGAPTTVDGATTPYNLQVTRLWGEVRFNGGHVLFGRTPVHWGTGMVFNAGNDPTSEFGDTTDRVLVTGRAGQMFLMGGFEQRVEGFANVDDDYRALVASVLYQSEKAALGIYSTLRFRNEPDQVGSDAGKFTSGIIDLWGEAELGPASIEGEFATILGGGDLDASTNDIRVTQVGGNLNVGFNPERLRLGVLGGFATGDADTTDNQLRTFSFDPDYNISLMLFEEPMPVLEPAAANDGNQNRTFDAARTGYSISNALFVQPRVGFQLRDDLTADLSWLLATQAKADAASGDEGRGYGSEIDLNVRWDPIEHFWMRATGGLLLPGSYYSEFSDADLGGDFNQPSFGGRLITTVEF